MRRSSSSMRVRNSAPRSVSGRALAFVKDSHVRHTRDNVYAIAQPIHCEAFPVEKRSCTTALAISPTLSAFVEPGSSSKESYNCSRRFPTNERSRLESTCV